MSYPYAHCPVCGNDVSAPFGDCDMCPCCGVEFGIDDAFYSHKELRDGWIHAGMGWWSTHTPAPREWNAEEQLKQVTEGAPE